MMSQLSPFGEVTTLKSPKYFSLAYESSPVGDSSVASKMGVFLCLFKVVKVSQLNLTVFLPE